jgi:membrane protein DedA with SNARE-associated domain
MGLTACIGLFAAVVATWIAVSGPGEAALVSAGVIAAQGDEQIAAVLAIAFAGTVAGSVAAYWLGRAGGRRLLLRPGPFLAWRARALARSEAIAQRHPFLASLLVPGWFAGVNEISPRPFIAGSALSGVAWTLTIGLGTFYVGPSLISLYDAVGDWVTIAVIAAATAAVLLFLMRRARRQRVAGRAGLIHATPPTDSSADAGEVICGERLGSVA